MTTTRPTPPPAGNLVHVHCAGCRDLRPHRHKNETTLICQACGRGRGLPLDAAAFDDPGPVTRTVAPELPRMNGHAQSMSDALTPIVDRAAEGLIAVLTPNPAPQQPTCAGCIESAPRIAVLERENQTLLVQRDDARRERDIAAAEAVTLRVDVDRWTARVKLLEAERDEAIRILQGGNR